jgi:hypothetical protein
MPDQSYKVGYGKPPENTRFKPGQSGNPKGKLRGARGLRTELRTELSELVTITENGKSRRIPKRRIVIKALVAKALKGDVRAAEKIMQLVIQAEGFEDPRSERNRLSDADRQIVELLLGQLNGECDAPEDGKAGSAE